MENLKAKVEQLIADAGECDLLAGLATENDKREIFSNVANQCRSMADAIRRTIAHGTDA
jgi:hypothetical protein